MRVFRSTITKGGIDNAYISIAEFKDELSRELFQEAGVAKARRSAVLEYGGRKVETYVPKKSGRDGSYLRFQDRSLIPAFFEAEKAKPGQTAVFTEIAPDHFVLSIDRETEQDQPSPAGRRFAAPSDYATALTSLATERELALLKAHALRGECSMSELASLVGVSSYTAINLQYGTLAHKIADTLHLEPVVNGKRLGWVATMIDWRTKSDQKARAADDDGDFRSFLHKNVILGLHLAGHLTDGELSKALAALNKTAPKTNGRTAAPPPLDLDEAINQSIGYMVNMAKKTASNSNGQETVRIVKNKDLLCTSEELAQFLEQKLRDQNHRCALTKLPLQYHGTHHDEQLVPSLDRIDSQGHYELTNLQVVCKFANRWKSDMPDPEFRRLLEIVRAQTQT